MIKIKLKKNKIIKLNSSTGVFIPTQTTHYLLNTIEKNIDKKKKLNFIDMGCGNGVLGISLLKIFKNINKLVFTDVSKKSLEDCEKNIKINHLKNRNYELVISNVFQKISKQKFDVIINDISGISEFVAEISPWFNKVSCKSGKNGTNLTINFLKHYKKYLKIKGKVFFPLISLSNENIIFDYLKKNNIKYKIILEKKWPLPQSMTKHNKFLKKLRSKKYINFDEKFGLIIANTKIIYLS